MRQARYSLEVIARNEVTESPVEEEEEIACLAELAELMKLGPAKLVFAESTIDSFALQFSCELPPFVGQ